MCPCMHIDLDKIAENARRMIEITAAYGIEIMGVTKVFGGELPIASVLVSQGIRKLGDSRIENIKNYASLDCEKWLIRMPTFEEAEEVIEYCDVSLNSELATLQVLNREAVRQGRTHKVILMVDLGDLREGYIKEEELADCAAFVKDAPGLELYGLGTNLTCFSFVQSDEEKMDKLLALARKYDATTCISGGNSATVHLMLEGGIPKGINSLRLGESLLFGRERACYEYLPDMHKDAFVMEAEIIEAKEKPSMPIGRIGADSYGRVPVFEDRGIRKRVICAMGRQDVDVETMWPMEQGVEIIGASSDHLIVDVTEAEHDYKTGEKIRFRLGYFAVMRAFTSKYVEKRYEGDVLYDGKRERGFSYIYTGHYQDQKL